MMICEGFILPLIRLDNKIETIDFCRNNTYYKWHLSSKESRYGLDEGLLVLSRYSDIKDFKHFNLERDICHVPGMIGFTLGDIRFYCVHLIPILSCSTIPYTVSVFLNWLTSKNLPGIRKRHLNLIKNDPNRLPKIILMGDLNVSSTSDEFNYIIEELQLEKPLEIFNTVEKERSSHSAQIDFILFSYGFGYKYKVSRIDNYHNSDHYPLISNIEI